MFDAVSHSMLSPKESVTVPEEGKASETAAHAELQGGLERDLERLQRLMDEGVEQLRRSFAGMTAAMNSEAAGEHLCERFRADADRVVTSLQFHDLASQMISNMRARAVLLEIAAVTAAPGAMVEARTRLLAEALELSKRSPGANCDHRGEVDLF